MLKKILAWLAIAFVVFYIIKNPEAAAEVTKRIASSLGQAAASLGTFVGSLI